MEYLFSRINTIKELLRDKFILLLLDYDGTLSPIAENPGKAAMPRGTKSLLQDLSRNPYCKLGIISGRSLQNLKKVIGVAGIIYAGNHGLEIESPKIEFESQVSARAKSTMRNIAADIKKRLSGIKGVLIEDKGMTLSVHYRLVGKKDMPALEKIFLETTSPYTDRERVVVNSGKKVFEIKPPVNWDKGKVALWLFARQQFISGLKDVLPVYIGDDSTDEDAFKALKRKGLTVFVGLPGNSKADYYLKDTREVAKFLRLIPDLRSN